jgi:endonuclease/exonuclease/phosphatase family metal-dependent hydrolase
MPVRIGTFNCENLFSRAKILNLTESNAEFASATAALKAADQLRALLRKPTFTAADKAKIKSLLSAGKGFFTFEEDRGKLMSGATVVASGAGDFRGHIRFTKSSVGDVATRNTGKVIKALNVDVLCTVEVEDRGLLGDFNSQVLGAKRFVHHMVIDGNDERGIDVGLLSKLELRTIRTHVDDMDGTSRTFSRDCTEYETRLADGRSLWILCNHLKSQGFGAEASNDARRKKQAARVRAILEERFDLANELVVVAGDLNDEPDSDPLTPLLSLPNLSNIVDTLPAGDRFTHIFGTKKSQLDYLLVSKPLKDTLTSVAVERRGMHKVAGHFPTVTKAADAASDHAAVVAEFAL